MSLQLISRKGNVGPGRLEKRLSTARTQLEEREAKLSPPQSSPSRIPVDLIGQRMEPELSKIISGSLCRLHHLRVAVRDI